MSAAQSGFPDNYAPVTSTIGFVRAGLDQVSSALARWRSELHGDSSVSEVNGSFAECVRRLEPLVSRVRPRELLLATKDPDWTAIFDCGLTGGGQSSTVGFLSEELRVQGLVLTFIPDRTSDDGHADRYGARQFELFGPIRTDFLNIVRTISVVRDGTRWRFDAAGVPQDFEEPMAYSCRRIQDRLTPEMLVRYAAALGLRPFDEDFYLPQAVLVTSPIPVPAEALTMTLPEVRAWTGIE